MKILIDWDQPYISGSYAIKRGIKLILYAIFKGLHLKPNFVKEIYEETDKYSITISQINQLLGIQTIYGIRDNVNFRHKDTIEQLKLVNDIRRHIHIGDDGPDKKRLWEPPLTQSKDTWHFDEDFYNGHEVKLKEGELPIFHVDRPYRLQTYIQYLYEHRNELE